MGVRRGGQREGATLAPPVCYLISFSKSALQKCSEKLNLMLLGTFDLTSAPAAWASPPLRFPLIRLTRLQKGSRGYTPWAASDSAGERGSPSYFLHQRKYEQNEVFCRARKF